MTVVDAKAQQDEHMPWFFTGLRFFFQSKATGSGGLKYMGYCKEGGTEGTYRRHELCKACGIVCSISYRIICSLPY
jgi:hypothetical protein